MVPLLITAKPGTHAPFPFGSLAPKTAVPGLALVPQDSGESSFPPGHARGAGRIITSFSSHRTQQPRGHYCRGKCGPLQDPGPWFRGPQERYCNSQGSGSFERPLVSETLCPHITWWLRGDVWSPLLYAECKDCPPALNVPRPSLDTEPGHFQLPTRGTETVAPWEGYQDFKGDFFSRVQSLACSASSATRLPEMLGVSCQPVVAIQELVLTRGYVHKLTMRRKWVCNFPS